MGNSSSTCFNFSNTTSTVEKESKIKLISKPEFKHKKANQHSSTATALNSKYTIVILGVAGAGKSCLFQHLANQSQFLLSPGTTSNSNTLDAPSRKALKKQMVIQLVLEMKQTLETMENRHISPHYHSTRFYISYIKGYNTEFVQDWVPFHQQKVPIEVVKALTRLWKDPTVRSVHGECLQGRTNGIQLFDRLEELCRNEYIPTERDCLLLQLPSENVQLLEMNWLERNNHSVHLTFCNIDGKASELVEWSRCFERANAILFVHPVVGVPSQIEESLELFQTVCRSNWFVGLPIVVVFSKWDLLLQREAVHVSAKWITTEKKRIQGEFTSKCRTHSLFSCWRTRGVDEPLDISQFVSIFR